MADELKITSRINLKNGTHKFAWNPGTITVDQAGTGKQGGVFNIDTTEESVGFSEVGTEGWLAMQNHATANFVTFGPYSTDATAMIAMGRMEAGEVAMMRLDPSAVLYLKSDTATSEVEITVIED